MRFWPLVALVVAVLAGILFVPVYLVSPELTSESLSSYYLGGFIFVEVCIFLLNNGKSEEVDPSLLCRKQAQGFLMRS